MIGLRRRQANSRSAGGAILDLADERASITGGFLDVVPLLVGHERLPGSGFGLLVRPAEQVDEFGLLGAFGFPHCDDVEPIPLHDARSVVAEARVKCVLVRLEDFVDAQLVDHLWAS